MGIVNQPIEDRVGVSGVRDHLVPSGHGQLAGDDGRASAVTLLEDLKQVVAGFGVERFEPLGPPLSGCFSRRRPLGGCFLACLGSMVPGPHTGLLDPLAITK